MKAGIGILLIFSLVIVCVSAAAGAVRIVSEDKPVVVGFGQEHEFQFDQTSPANTTVLLKIKSRMDFTSLGGSMHFLKMFLNGKEIKPTKGRLISRLMNKPLESPVAEGLSYNWYSEKNGWNVLYAPDFQSAYAGKYYVDDPYVYVLDITDMVNPIAENRLKVANTAAPDFVSTYGLNNKLDLVVGLLELDSRSGKSPTMDFKESELVNIINRGTPAAEPAKYKGEVKPGGGIVLRVGKNSYSISSSFSYPDAGFNHLVAGNVSGDNQKGFKVSAKGNTVIARGRNYSISRKVVFLPQRIEVSDSIRNLNTAQALGLCVKHELDLSKLTDAPIRLAGNPDASFSEYHSYGNPSVHVLIPDGGLGMLVEDDVFRHQVKLYAVSDVKAQAPVAGIRTDMLRLAPGETYTLKWSVYLVAGPDYYDFINLVRKDWGANYTALGPWRWGFMNEKNLSVGEVRDIIKKQGIKYYIESDWALWKPDTRIAMGTDVFSKYWEPYRQSRIDTLEKLRKASPDIKTFWYFNSRRETADDTLTRFKDSLMTDAAGNPFQTYWQNCGATNPSYTMIPTLKNSFGKAMLQTARRYLDDIKLDGIYWDEVEGMMFNSIHYSFGMYDGHSCLLDPDTWRIQREVGILPLLEKDFYREVARIVHSRGKILLGNGPTGFKTTLQDKVQRMTEIQHNDVYGYEGNLQTPLGYTSWSNNWDDMVHALEQAMLPAVCLTTVLPHDISQYLFPFTPIELHSGYLLGKERIVAVHSGRYGWQNNQSLVSVHHFDALGKLTNLDFPTTINARASTKVTLKTKEAIVLERLPVIFVPAKQSTASVSKVSYSSEGISVTIVAPRGGVLKVFDGTYKLINGSVVNAAVNGKPIKAKVAGKSLKVDVPRSMEECTVKIGKI